MAPGTIAKHGAWRSRKPDYRTRTGECSGEGSWRVR